MLNRIVFVVLLCLSMVSDALAEEFKRVAVLEFRSVDVDSKILLNLSDQSRRAAVELLSDDEYLIMTRENMMQILDDMGLDASCMEGQCEVEIGRNIQADIIVTGDVIQIEGTNVLTLKLYDTANGSLLSTVEVEAQDLLSLKRDTYAQSRFLLQDGLKLNDGMAPAQNVGFQGTVKSEEWFVGQEATVLVDFESSPTGAAVLMDGKMLCTETPCRKEIPKKSHQVVFQKERYFPYQMNIDAGQEQQFSATLEPNFGTLNIQTVAGVQFALDGKAMGVTPIRSFPVDPGLHTVTVDDPCYVGQEYRFQIKAGGVETLNEYPMEARESALSVRATDKEGNPVAAKVGLNGEKLGVTPMTEKVPLCSTDLRISMDGEVLKPELSLKEHQLSEIEVVMGAEPPRICNSSFAGGEYPVGTYSIVYGSLGVLYGIGYVAEGFTKDDQRMKDAGWTAVGLSPILVGYGVYRFKKYNRLCTEES